MTPQDCKRSFIYTAAPLALFKQLPKGACAALLVSGLLSGCVSTAKPKPGGATLDGDTTFSVEGDADSGDRFDASEVPAPQTVASDVAGAAYLASVETQIQPAWGTFLGDCRTRLPKSHSFNNGSLTVVLKISIDEQGKIVSVGTATQSGNTEFDAAAKEVVMDLSTLPQADDQWLSDDGHVYLKWTFANDATQAGAANAAIEKVMLPLTQAVPALLAKQKPAIAARRIADADIAPAQRSKLLHSVALAVLGHALQSEDPKIVRIALEVVSRTKEAQLLDLVRKTGNAIDPQVMAAYAEALGAIGQASDAEALTRLAMQSSGAVATAAARSLVTLGAAQTIDEAARLSSKEPAQRASALAIYSGVLSSEAVPALSAILANPKGSLAERLAAANALGFQSQKSNAALKSLVAAVEVSDASIQTAALQAIAAAAKQGVRSRATYWKVMERTKNKDERIRSAAFEASAALEPKRFAKELSVQLSRIKRGSSGGAMNLSMLGVFRSLGPLDSSIALGRLLELSENKNPAYRVVAAQGLLQKRTSGKAAKALTAMATTDESAQVRLAALPVFTQAEDLRPRLQEDPSERVQQDALALLSKKSGQEASAQSAAQKLAGASTLALQVRWVAAWLGGS